jgi:hypothetical protein
MPLARVNSEVQAANLALAHLGVRITALDETSEAARAVTDQFASVRVQLLRLHNWNFAEGFETLSADPAAGPGRFSKMFPLPADCIRVRSVDGLEEDDWNVSSSPAVNASSQLAAVLSCDLDAPRVCFTRDVLQVSVWDALFLEVFALLLASHLAGRVGATGKSASELKAEAMALLPTARRISKREAARSRVSQDVSYLSVRR